MPPLIEHDQTLRTALDGMPSAPRAHLLCDEHTE
jgi:hypothetical protein